MYNIYKPTLYRKDDGIRQAGGKSVVGSLTGGLRYDRYLRLQQDIRLKQGYHLPVQCCFKGAVPARLNLHESGTIG
jgi:hypothetical protein